MSMLPANIIHQFLQTAEIYPDRNAIICGKKNITYLGLRQAVISKAAYFQNKGVGRSDQVLLLVPMSIELYINLLAIFYLGAVAIVIDQVGDRKKISVYLNQADCKAAVFSRKAWILILTNPVLRKIPIKIKGRRVNTKDPVQLAEIDPDHPALITFTTGSTGTPKAALRSHGFLYRQYETLKEIIEPYPGETDFVSLPIVLLINLGVGAVSIIPEKILDKLKPSDFKLIAKDIAKNKIERLTASPFLLKGLVKYLEKNGLGLKSKRIFTGGGPVFPDEANMIKQSFNPENFTIIYGSTEAEPISTITVAELIKRDFTQGLCVGQVYRDIALKIIQITEGAIKNYNELPFGTIGEIIVSGPHVLDCYFKSPKALKENKIMEGDILWHRTGDAGFIGADGKLYLTGRADQMIFQNDTILSPFIIENQLKSIDGIIQGTALVDKDKRMVIFIEISKTSKKQAIEIKIQELHFPDHTLIYINKMPMDSRHRTKIDYNKLRV